MGKHLYILPKHQMKALGADNLPDGVPYGKFVKHYERHTGYASITIQATNRKITIVDDFIREVLTSKPTLKERLREVDWRDYTAIASSIWAILSIAYPLIFGQIHKVIFVASLPTLIISLILLPLFMNGRKKLRLVYAIITLIYSAVATIDEMTATTVSAFKEGDPVCTANAECTQDVRETRVGRLYYMELTKTYPASQVENLP